jgi:TonB-dependent SusC/RagA subfamily outer membrane receptor
LNRLLLKDAGATAIYGNRGANGVVIIKLNQCKEFGCKWIILLLLALLTCKLATKKGTIFWKFTRSLRFEKCPFGWGFGAALGPVFPTNGTQPIDWCAIAAQPNTDWLKFFHNWYNY